jgi:hypothetical protein
MISWIVRGLLAGGGVVQMMMALILLTFVVAVLAFWPERWTVALNRLHGPR